MPTTDREQELTNLIRTHDVAYYVYGKPTITDFDYDVLMRELKEVERVAGRALPGSPTQRVGSDLDAAFAKVNHLRPMLSLDNVFTPAEAVKFFSALPLQGTWTSFVLTVEAKIDGLAVELRYRDGQLAQAVTRGDGAVGDDVTANVRAIRGVPLAIDYPADLDVRGEVYMRRSVFASLNEAREAAGDEAFANPRNAAAGSFKQRNPSEVAARRLSFVAYWSTMPAGLTQQDVTAELMDLGFPTLNVMPMTVKDTNACMSWVCSDSTDPTRIASAISAVEGLRDLLDLEIDGAVIKLNSRELQEEVGARSKAPLWGCAYKFPPARTSTILEGIEITVGRTGQITPNARLKPVLLSGSTVSNASLMNVDELARIGSPGIGDEVWVEKSAEIIPRVVGVKTKNSSAPWQLPVACPFCGTALVRKGVHFFDPNKACPERVFMRLRHATGKGYLDWDGMGEAQVRSLVQAGVRSLPDLFALSDEGLNVLKPAARKKFLAERERVKQAPLWRKLACLGIEDVGRSLGKDLANRYGSLDAIIAAIETGDVKSVLGDVALGYLIAYLKDEINDLARLEELGFVFADTTRTVGPLSGKTLVITGGLMSGTREVVSTRIEAAGGVTKSSVTKAVDYLVVGEAPGDGKTKAAARHGTKIISEIELYALMNVPMPTDDGAPDLNEI